MIFNYVSKVESGYIILDIIYMVALSSFIFYILQSNFKSIFIKKIENYIYYWNKTNRIKFSSSKNGNSIRQKAIMYYISKKNDSSIKVLSEILEVKYNNNTDSYEDRKTGLYRVDQDTIFNIDKDIMGRVYYEEKEKTDYGTKLVYVEYIFLEIFSSKLTMNTMEDWIEKRLKEYEDHLQDKIIDKQLLFDVGYNIKEKSLDVIYSSWQSNVTFENRFFTNKDMIFDKIKFFMNNMEWYKERGIPHTMGFLLWGEPGCGKTGFIKALMNYTDRHGINIKLNNKFDLNKLRNLMIEDKIADVLIPQNKRIFIFEDIDCMGEIVHCREKEEVKLTASELIKMKEDDKLFELLKDDTSYNNNMSYFLNILDGLQECPGRIIVMTTNKPDKLDKAMIRPGRIDHNIHFTLATLEDTISIIEFYWKEKIPPTYLKKLRQIDHNKLSHAMIVNICRTNNTIIETCEQIVKY
jgi:ATP-dependent Zn protease